MYYIWRRRKPFSYVIPFYYFFKNLVMQRFFYSCILLDMTKVYETLENMVPIIHNVSYALRVTRVLYIKI